MEKTVIKPPAIKPAAPTKAAAPARPSFFGDIIAELKKVTWPTAKRYAN